MCFFGSPFDQVKTPRSGSWTLPLADWLKVTKPFQGRFFVVHCATYLAHLDDLESQVLQYKQVSRATSSDKRVL